MAWLIVGRLWASPIPSASSSRRSSYPGRASDVNRVALSIFIAGQRFAQEFPAVPNQTYTFVWDGRDARGQPAASQWADIVVGYVYEADYAGAANVGGTSPPITTTFDRNRR